MDDSGQASRRAALTEASRRFDATRADDSSTAGRRQRAQARLALVEALVADGWQPTELVLQQVEADRRALALPHQAGAPQDVPTLVS